MMILTSKATRLSKVLDKLAILICCLSLCSLTAASALNSRHSDQKESLLQNDKDVNRLDIALLSIAAFGHLHPILSIGEELVSRGHNVTLISGRMSDKPESAIRMMVEKKGIRYLYNRHIVFESPKTNDFSITEIRETIRKTARGMLKFWFEELTEDDKQRWDILLFDAETLATAGMCIYSQDKIPVVMSGSTVQTQHHTLPTWPWPHVMMGQAAENMPFFDRLKAAMITVTGLGQTLHNYIMVSSVQDSLSRYCPDASPSVLATGPGTTVPHIVPTAIGFEYSRSLMPLVHYVGPLLSQSPDPLSNDLEQWLNSKEKKSVVYISMGSLANITKTTGKAFINGVLETNYSVVWALRQPEIVEGLEIDTKRVFIIRWAPQLSVLQHRAISLAIVHGGFKGIHESLYNGVPLIVVPAFTHADQISNAGRVVNQGLGLSLDSSTITAEKITSSIAEIDSGDYRRNVEHLQKIFVSAGGVEKAADLVEYYKEVGYNHLIPAYAKYEWSWVQYYNVDVYTLLAVILVSVIYCSLKCCQFVSRRTCCKRKEKKE